MSKRKFEQYRENHGSPPQESLKALAQRERIHGLLENGKTTIFRALKVARGFERQKLGRRQKNAAKEKKDEEFNRIKDEVEALKKLELEKVAESHLCKTLLKVKSVAASGLLPTYVGKRVEEGKKAQETASLNVQARLYNSTPVRTAVNEIVERVRECVSIGQEKSITTSRKASASTHPNLQSSVDGILQKPGQEHGDGESLSGDSSLQSKTDDLSLSDEHDVNSKLINQFQTRVASSDEKSEDDVVNQQRQTAADWSGSESPDQSDDHDLSDSELRSKSSTKPRLKAPKPTKPIKSTNTTTNTTSTTFLPTLSMGGYFSGDDSDSASDLSDVDAEPKRNRRGQRARRDIYEKKFGKNANHVKKAALDRRQGWDLRKGAQAEDEGSGAKRKKPTAWKAADYGERTGEIAVAGGAGGKRGPQSSGANMEPVLVKQREGEKNGRSGGPEGKVHPSWEAARKAKESKKVLPFQGKKVTFD